MNTTLSTRRQFLAGGAALPFALRAMAQGHATTPQWIFLGTNIGKGIYRARWDAATGEIGSIELAAATDRPDFFVLHPKLPVLYTANAVAGEKAGVSSYRIDKSKGALTLINRVSSHGDGPCAVSVTATGRNVFVANYTGGTVASYDVDAENGSLRDNSSFDCRNNPVCGVLGASEIPAGFCTYALRDDFARSEIYMLSCNLGEDALELFRLNSSSNPLADPVRIPARAGSGPRHVAFHPTKKWVYCIHELDCTVDLYDWSETSAVASMNLRENSVTSTLVKGTPLAGNAACEIFVSDDGRFVYTCTRGADEIVVYRVHPDTGLLNEQQRISSGGKIPRYIALDPSRKWLMCCNQGVTGLNQVGNVTVFTHDPATGKLSETPKTFAAETPMFTIFV